MKYNYFRLTLIFLVALLHSQAKCATLTIALMPQFSTTAAPLDEIMLRNMACVFSTEDKNEFRRFHDAISQANVIDSRNAPRINFRQALYFDAENSKQEYFFEMKSDSKSSYLIKESKAGNTMARLVDAVSWDKLIGATDFNKFDVISSPEGIECKSTVFVKPN